MKQHANHSHHHHSHHHAAAGDGQPSRRDFFRVLLGGALAGASILELAYHRAAWARAAAPSSEPDLFDIQKVGNGVYFALARPQALINCNAAIFVRSKDVVVVDAHSKPSAAASLIGQIKREITPKPVRYVVNTHFHWDHTQGNHAYRLTGEKVDFIASAATKQLMADLAVARMKASVAEVPQQIDALAQAGAHVRPRPAKRPSARTRYGSSRPTRRSSRITPWSYRRSPSTNRMSFKILRMICTLIFMATPIPPEMLSFIARRSG